MILELDTPHRTMTVNRLNIYWTNLKITLLFSFGLNPFIFIAISNTLKFIEYLQNSNEKFLKIQIGFNIEWNYLIKFGNWWAFISIQLHHHSHNQSIYRFSLYSSHLKHYTSKSSLNFNLRLNRFSFRLT